MNWILTKIFKKTFFLALFLLVTVQAVEAQNFSKDYQYAKSFFNDGKYNLAMESFRPLMFQNKENIYVEYAYFYYALSALKLNFFNLAKNSLVQIKKNAPNWSQINEVNYWLAKIFFIEGNYFQAMALLSKIKIEDYIDFEDVVNLKRQYLSSIDDVEILRMLREDYPNDDEIKRAAKQFIFDNKPGSEIAVRLLNDSSQNQASDDIENGVNHLPALMKDRYKVSVLFPFLTATLQPTPTKKTNQQILDLYDGMRMANDTLRKIGIFVDLFAYDTQKNKNDDAADESIKKLFQLEELRNTDCIVGPLFPKEIEVAKTFSKQLNIKMISPVSGNSNFTKDNSNAFLFLPSFETIGVRAAEQIATKSENKNCMVFYGEQYKDSVEAFSFMNRAFELGVKIVFAEKFTVQSTSKIISLLTTPTKWDESNKPVDYKFKRDSIGSIFVASNNPLIYTKVISSVESRGDSIIIVGDESWLDDMSVDFRKYERLNILFASPNFTDFSSKNYVAFRDSYIKTHGSFPEDYLNYSKVGFDFMMWLGNVLKKYGVNFEDGLMKDGKMECWFTQGYSLSKNRDNSIVPFINFKNGMLMPVK